jgi:glutamate-1-semialdehyde 2,1-aminomutase
MSVGVQNDRRLEKVQAEVIASLPASAHHAAKSSSYIPGSTTRARFWWPFPIYAAGGEGARLTDIDGRTYIDCSMGFGSLILGHRHPHVTKALLKQVNEGWMFGIPCKAEGDLARRIIANVPGAERIVFTGNGTEATLGALRLARVASGRQKVAKFEGGWHGLHDFLMHSYSSFEGDPANADTIPDTGGIHPLVKDTVVVLPYNNTAAFTRIKRESKELACVIVEAVQGGGGAIAGEREFLRELRELCRKLGVLFILDEVITGFRFGLAGAAGLYELDPDLVILGKLIGGGMSVGAVCGPSRVLDLVTPVTEHDTPGGEEQEVTPVAGAPKPVTMGSTHTANPMTMTAGLATLEVLLNDPTKTYGNLNRLGDKMRSGIKHALAEAGITGHATGAGSLWGLHFSQDEPRNVRDQVHGDTSANLALSAYLGLEGILVSAPMHLAFLSTAHTDADVDSVVNAHRRSFERMKAAGWFKN